jgi:hypothetical protein
MPDASPGMVTPEWDLFSLPDPGDSLVRAPFRLYAAEDDRSLIDVRLATLQTRQALVLVTEAGEWFADRFDLDQRQRIARTPVPAETQLLDFRPDGKYWLSTTRLQPWRLRVWETTTVVDEESDRKLVTLEYQRELACDAAVFSGEKLILSRHGKLEFNASRLESGRRDFVSPRVSRQIASPRLVARHFGESQPRYSKPLRSSLFVSPGRRYFVDVADSRIALFRASDGMLAGHLGNSHVLPNVQLKGQFRSDGRQLAVLNQGQMEFWDLNRHICRHIFPAETGINGWDSDFAQFDSRVLYWPAACAVWQLAAGSRYDAVEHPERNAWSIRSDGKNIYLLKNPLPGDMLANQLTPFLQQLNMPHDQVSLRSVVKWARDDRDAAGLQASLESAFTEQLERSGTQVVEVADTSIRISVKCLGMKLAERIEIMNLAGTEPFLAFDDGRRFFVVHDDRFEVLVEATNRKFGTLRLLNETVRLSGCPYRVDRDAENPRRDLQRQAEEALVAYIASRPLPDFWIADNADGDTAPRQRILGHSEFDGRSAVEILEPVPSEVRRMRK